jgi:hypothetical protein
MSLKARAVLRAVRACDETAVDTADDDAWDNKF